MLNPTTTSLVTTVELHTIRQTVHIHLPTQETSIYGAGTWPFRNENIDIVRVCIGDSGKSEHITSYG
jgi:hypothetical protein